MATVYIILLVMRTTRGLIILLMTNIKREQMLFASPTTSRFTPRQNNVREMVEQNGRKNMI